MIYHHLRVVRNPKLPTDQPVLHKIPTDESRNVEIEFSIKVSNSELDSFESRDRRP